MGSPESLGPEHQGTCDGLTASPKSCCWLGGGMLHLRCWWYSSMTWGLNYVFIKAKLFLYWNIQGEGKLCCSNLGFWHSQMLSEQIREGRWKEDLKDVRAESSPLVRVLLFQSSSTSDLFSGRRPHGKPEKRDWCHVKGTTRLVKKNKSPDTCGTKCESMPQKKFTFDWAVMSKH